MQLQTNITARRFTTRDRAFQNGRRNERFKRRLEVIAINRAKPTLRKMKQEFTRLLGTPQATLDNLDEKGFDFADEYGRLISNEVMFAYVLGYYETWRARQGKAMFAITFDSVADRETWYEIYDLMGDKIAVSADEFYDLDKTLRSKYWTVAKTQNEVVIDDMRGLITEALGKGWGSKEFTTEANILYGTAGLDPLAPHHLAQVYRTNQAIAYEAAHQQFLIDAGIDGSVMWVTANDDQVRDEHFALEGVVRKASEWGGMWAPVGYNCRCSMADVPDTMKGKEYTPDMEAGLQGTSDYKFFDRSPVEMLRAA